MADDLQNYKLQLQQVRWKIHFANGCIIINAYQIVSYNYFFF